MDSKVADILRHVFILAVLFAIGLFAYKQYKKYEAKSDLVTAMRADVADANFFRALRESDAKATLLRCVGRMAKARQMGVEPTDFINLVYERKKGDGPREDNPDGVPVREKLVRATVSSAFEHAKQLGLLEEPSSIASLLAGEMPLVTPAPVFEHIVDPALSPGIEMIVANLTLEPTPRIPGATPTDIQVAAFRELINDLTEANIIDKNAQKRIFDDFAPTRPKPLPVPEPPPERVRPAKVVPAPEPPPAPKPEPAVDPAKTGYVPDKPEPNFVLPK